MSTKTMQIVKISPTLSINYTIHKWGPGSIDHQTTSPSTSEPETEPEDLGTWVVLISGLGDTQVTWEDQIKAFVGAGYTVLTYDNRGVGGSSRPVDDRDAKWTSDEMASDLREVIRRVGLPRYHMVGMSMGGMIAQSYAVKYGHPKEEGGVTTEARVDDGPDEMISLTLACTYSYPGPFCARMFSLWRDMAVKMSVADACREVLLWCFTPEWFSDPKRKGLLAAVEGAMSEADTDMGLTSYLAQLNVIMTFDSRGWVGRLGGKRAAQTATTDEDKSRPVSVFVLVGERDGLIPHCQSRELYDSIDGAEWVVTKGAHACNNEYPDEFNENVVACFKKAEERFWS